MRGPILQLLNGAFALVVTANTLTANKNLRIKGDYIAGNIPQIDTDGETLKWITPGSLGGWHRYDRQLRCQCQLHF